MLCDIILLNFLKGAEHYKARKFEEVSYGAGAATGLGPLWGWGHARVTSGWPGPGPSGVLWGWPVGGRAGSTPEPPRGPWLWGRD